MEYVMYVAHGLQFDQRNALANVNWSGEALANCSYDIISIFESGYLSYCL